MTEELYNQCREKAEACYLERNLKREKNGKNYKKKKLDKENKIWSHVQNVEKITQFLCEKMNLNSEYTRIICLGAILHDIGKSRKAKKWRKKKLIDYMFSYEQSYPQYHNELGADYSAKDFLGKDFMQKEKDFLCSMIKYHRGKMLERKKYKKIKLAIAVTIVRTADKLVLEIKDIGKIKNEINKLSKEGEHHEIKITN